MTIHELTATVVRLPVAERLILLEAISRSLRTTLASGELAGTPLPASDPLYAQIAALAGDAVPPHSAVRRLLGIARSTEEALSDAAVRDAIADEMIARHS